MQRVTRASAYPIAQAIPASPGTPGHFGPGDPVANVPATIPGYEWFEGVQEELVAAILDSGQALDAGALTQVRTSIRRLAGAGVAALTVNTTLTADDAGVVGIAIAAARTFTLPAASAAGGRPIRFTFVRTDTTAFVATVQRAGADTIEGLTSITIPVGGRLALVSDGVSAWRVAGGVARGMQGFTSSGTFTVPAGVYRIRASVTGGGGGGAGSNGSNGGSGGGAGGTAIGWFDVTPGQAITVTIGAGGAAGASGIGSGGSGGSSSLGSLCSATGGAGGSVGSGGGAPGVGTGGQANLSGGHGMDSSNASDPTIGGGGGASFWGGGGRAGISGGGVAGLPPGSGGGGSFGSGNTATGAAGAAGIVVVEW